MVCSPVETFHSSSYLNGFLSYHCSTASFLSTTERQNYTYMLLSLSVLITIWIESFLPLNICIRLYYIVDIVILLLLSRLFWFVRSGKGSPGFADLGQRSLHSSVPSKIKDNHSYLFIYVNMVLLSRSIEIPHSLTRPRISIIPNLHKGIRLQSFVEKNKACFQLFAT